MAEREGFEQWIAAPSHSVKPDPGRSKPMPSLPMGECLFPRLFALRYTHDFEGDLAIILSNNLAFEPHT